MVAKLEPVKKQFPDVSYADLYTLAGVTALEASGLKVPWRAGRVDAISPDAVTPDGRLPGADKGAPNETAKALRLDVFYRMGFDDREIVALSGAHNLGRCHPDASGYSGPWSPTPNLLSNSYYNLLLKARLFFAPAFFFGCALPYLLVLKGASFFLRCRGRSRSGRGPCSSRTRAAS